MNLNRPLLLLLVASALGCRQEMYNQPRTKPLRPSPHFANGTSARPIPPGTVSRGEPVDNPVLLTGRIGTNLVTAFPFAIDLAGMQRGRESFEIYCAVCHGATGQGNGMIVLRGFPPPPSFHTDRLRGVPVGHIYDVIRSGYGVMYPYAARVSVSNRWEIAAYIRALQLSQAIPFDDLPAADRAQLENAP